MPRSRGANDPSDRVRLVHIRDAAREAMSFANGRDRRDLDSDRMLVRAILHAVLEIGEAASALGDDARAKIPEVPWAQVVKMRNVLIHVYWGVSNDKLWSTVQVDLPALMAAVDAALLRWPTS